MTFENDFAKKCWVGVTLCTIVSCLATGAIEAAAHFGNNGLQIATSAFLSKAGNLSTLAVEIVSVNHIAATLLISGIIISTFVLVLGLAALYGKHFIMENKLDKQPFLLKANAWKANIQYDNLPLYAQFSIGVYKKLCELFTRDTLTPLHNDADVNPVTLEVKTEDSYEDGGSSCGTPEKKLNVSDPCILDFLQADDICITPPRINNTNSFQPK